MNPFAWLSFLYILYFIVPSIFTEEINYYYNWHIENDDIFYARLFVFIVGVFISALLFIFRSNAIYLKQNKVTSTPIALFALWLIILVYISWVLKSSLSGDIFSTAFLYDSEAAQNPYKLKNISYLLLPLSIYMFFAIKKYWVFIPNVLVVLIDLLDGSRTTAFICIVPMLMCAIVINKKIYLPQMLMIFALMIVVGIVRSDNVIQGVPWYISAIGEFRETFITLPLFISDADYVGKGEFFGYVGSLFFGLLQPLRMTIAEAYTSPGRFMASDIGRGYGLGSNFIIESMHYGFVGFLVSISFLVSFLILIYRMINKFEIVNIVIVISLLVVFLRLIVREGIPVNIGLFLFITIFYIGPVFLLRKVKYNL